MTRKQSKTTIAELKELLTQDKDFLRPMLAEIVQQVLESEMDEAVETHENWIEATRYLNMEMLEEHKKEVARKVA